MEKYNLLIYWNLRKIIRKNKVVWLVGIIIKDFDKEIVKKKLSIIRNITTFRSGVKFIYIKIS